MRKLAFAKAPLIVSASVAPFLLYFLSFEARIRLISPLIVKSRNVALLVWGMLLIGSITSISIALIAIWHSKSKNWNSPWAELTIVLVTIVFCGGLLWLLWSFEALMPLLFT